MHALLEMLYCAQNYCRFVTQNGVHLIYHNSITIPYNWAQRNDLLPQNCLVITSIAENAYDTTNYFRWPAIYKPYKYE